MKTTISVKDSLGKEAAVLHSDGLKLHELIKGINPDNSIELDFENISYTTTAFLNASIGKYIIESQSPNETKKRLSFIGIEKKDVFQHKINLVLNNATSQKKREIHNDVSRSHFQL